MQRLPVLVHTRLLVLQAAWKMDTHGNASARVDVSAIKLGAARLQTRVLDRAMQVFGAAGLSPDTPLAGLWSWGRALRVLDGPDEVHWMVVGRAELQAYLLQLLATRDFLDVKSLQGLEERFVR